MEVTTLDMHPVVFAFPCTKTCILSDAECELYQRVRDREIDSTKWTFVNWINVANQAAVWADQPVMDIAALFVAIHLQIRPDLMEIDWATAVTVRQSIAPN